MIILKDGSKWIIDEEEYQGQSEDRKKKGRLPITATRKFVERLVAASDGEANADDEIETEYFSPRKWTSNMGGYWDANFDAFKEILSDVAIRKLENPWSNVYEMPWGAIIVTYKKEDSGGFDVAEYTKTFENYGAYVKKVKWMIRPLP